MTRKHVVRGGLTLFVLMALGLLALIWVQLAITPPPDVPPVEWIFADPLPTSPVCPGDYISTRTAIRINEPGGLYIYTPIRRAPEHPAVVALKELEIVGVLLSQERIPLLGDTIIASDRIVRTAFTADEVPGLVFDIDAGFIVPNLEPGPYVRLVVAGLDGRNALQAIRKQNFEVGDCGQ